MIKTKLILNVLGRLAMFTGFLMLSALIPSILYKSGDHYDIAVAAGLALITGTLISAFTKNNTEPGPREGYFIVALGWITISFFGCLPFLINGYIPSFTDAFFETMSGFTTTGATILTDIENMPEGLLYWRSMTQWIGGMGIIVLTIAIVPFLGIGGMQLFVAEVPGPKADKLSPRVKDTARKLWGIYVFFTSAEALLLKVGGMNWFDAINHAFTTMATGGYSTKNASIAYYDSPFIQYVIIVFMFIAGVNFSLSFFAMRGKLKKLYKDEEFRTYLGIVLGAAVIITIILFVSRQYGLEKAFRDSLFQVVSIVTTTGYITADYETWGLFVAIFVFMLMFVGGSAGSTGGGPKVVRNLLLLKNSSMEFRRQIHPQAIVPVRFNRKVVPAEVISNIQAFFFIYILIFVISSLVMLTLNLDLNTAIGSVAATLGNIGPGLGKVGAVGNYAEIPVFGKWYLSFLMLTGRLELFTVLILFSKAFWKK